MMVHPLVQYFYTASVLFRALYAPPICRVAVIVEGPPATPTAAFLSPEADVPAGLTVTFDEALLIQDIV